MTDRELMQQALEALEECTAYTSSESWSPSMTRECETAITALRAAIEQAHPNARVHHKMMIAMIKEHWRSIDLQWKGDPELCHAMGYEAGYNDAVARRVEPPAAESGAGFESLPASPQWQGLTDDERARFRQLGFVGVEIVEATLKERNS